MSDKIIINGIVIDKKVAKGILRKIVLKEVKNIKTKKNNTNEMVAMIQKTIQEEVECY